MSPQVSFVPPVPRRRPGRTRLIVFAAAVGALVWLAWLGWPSHTRVAARLTALASVEDEGWTLPATGVRTQSVRLQGANGLSFGLRVLLPDEAVAAPLPVALILGGHRTGRDAVNLLGHPGRLAVVALDYPYDGPERPRGVRESLSTLPPARRALLETPAAVALAVEWIVAQPWADPTRLDLVGVSLGTQFAAAAAALEPRISRVWFIQGGADSRRWLTHQLRERVPSPALQSSVATSLWWIAHGASLTPEKWIDRISPRPVTIVGATEDIALPPALVHALYDAAGEPRRLVWIEGGHVNPRRPETIRPLIDLIQPGVEARLPPAAPAPGPSS